MIASLRASILRGDATATSLAAAAVAAARASPWNDFVRVDEARAAATSRRLDAGARQDAPLFGVPFAAKANLCVAGETPTAGSAAVGGWVARADATAVARLAAAGAVLVGSTNCDEFGMGSTGEASAHGATSNPRDAAASPGGSSSGSAAAVAAGAVPFALGSDTGGSVRLPASWCGVVGLKPSYGRVSRHGLLAYCSSTDCVGVLATSVGDAAAVLRVIAGADGLDATCVDAPVEDYAGLLAAPSNFRVAAVAEEVLQHALRVAVALEHLPLFALVRGEVRGDEAKRRAAEAERDRDAALATREDRWRRIRSHLVGGRAESRDLSLIHI